MKKILLSTLILEQFILQQCQNPPTKEDRLEWWKDDRFGMFIHWGPVSIKGTEISWSRGREWPVEEYDSLYKQFNPVSFNALEWVQVAKAAGTKYIVDHNPLLSDRIKVINTYSYEKIWANNRSKTASL